MNKRLTAAYKARANDKTCDTHHITYAGAECPHCRRSYTKYGKTETAIGYLKSARELRDMGVAIEQAFLALEAENAKFRDVLEKYFSGYYPGVIEFSVAALKALEATHE